MKDSGGRTARYLPVMLDLVGRLCLVVGGGREALRKTRSLLEAGARVEVVSPELLPELKGLAERDLVAWKRAAWQPTDQDLRCYFLVVACTDNPHVNARIAALAERAGVLVNAVDQPEHCTFIMPAILRRGSLTIAVGTEGKSPAFASRIRNELAEQFGEAHGVLLDVLGALRPAVLRSGLPNARRAELFTRIVHSSALSCLLAGDTAGMYAQIHAILKEYEVPWPEEWFTWSEPAPAPPT